jgi:hypothetical protein
MSSRVSTATRSAVLVLYATSVWSQAPNLVPSEPAKAANYWCTWYAQNYWIQRGGEITDFAGISAEDRISGDWKSHSRNNWVSVH